MRHPEVDETDAAVRAEHHVAGLDVVVDHAALMHMREGFQNLAGDAQRLGFRQRATFLQVLGQRGARDVLHHHVRAALVGVAAHELQHVGVIELAADLFLPLEERPAPDPAPELGQRDLDDHRSVGTGEVLGLEENRHAAAGELFAELEAAIQGLPGGGLHHGQCSTQLGQRGNITPQGVQVECRPS